MRLLVIHPGAGISFYEGRARLGELRFSQFLTSALAEEWRTYEPEASPPEDDGDTQT